MNGKGIFIWQLSRCGDLRALATRLHSMGVKWLAVKAADGFLGFNDAHLPGLIEAVKPYGIAVWGWHYVYGARTEDLTERVKMLEAQVTKLTTQVEMLGTYHDQLRNRLATVSVAIDLTAGKVTAQGQRLDKLETWARGVALK